MTEEKEPKKTKRDKKEIRKRRLLVGIIAGALLVLLFYPKFSGGKRQHVRREAPIVETASTGLDPTLSRVGDLEITQERMGAQIDALIQAQEEVKQKIKEGAVSQQVQIDDLKNFFAEKLREIQTLQETERHSRVVYGEEGEEEGEPDISMVFVEAKEEESRQHVSEIIPANTIVRCKVVMGARASAGVGEPNQLDMVLLRPISNGWLPNGVRVEGFKDTIISAEAFGNATKKLAYLRARRMTRVFKDGSFIETDISGYVGGEHGGTGVVCTVIDPSWKAPIFAGATAALSEVSKAIGQQSSFLDVLKLGKTESNVNISIDALKRGSFQGAGAAWEKFADYFLKKEEKNAPFCLLEQGRTVDLIFDSQCAWGEKNIKEKLRIKRALEREALAKEKRYG